MTEAPRFRLDKKQAKAGEIVEVRALVSHVMETGLRRDPSGKLVPRKIINRFVCTVAGKEVFSVDFEPAIAANPYVQFKFRAREFGPGGADLDRRRRQHDRRQGRDQGCLNVAVRCFFQRISIRLMFGRSSFRQRRTPAPGCQGLERL